MNYFYVCVILVLVLCIYLYLTRNFNYWKNRNVPYIKPMPIFGNIYSMISFKKSMNMFLDDIYTKFKSPYFGFYVFDQPFLMIQDPELIKHVLVSDFEYFSDRSVMMNKNDKYSAKTLFMMQNPEWKITRTKTTSAFSSGKLKHMVPLILEVGEELVTAIKERCLNKNDVNCREFSVQYAINVISSCAFGFRAQAHDNCRFTIATKELQGTTISRGICMVSHFFAPVLVKLFGLKFVDIDSAKFLENVFLNAFEERKRIQSSRRDLMDLLIKMMEEDTRFDRDALVSLAFQYLVAGFETSGATISFILHELCLNEAIQDRLRNEILTVLDNHETVTFDAIQEIVYLDMVVKDRGTLVSLAFQYLVAGFETSGATISFILYELCLNEVIQDRLRNEILTVLENHEIVTFDAIQEMVYLDMVVKEGLRKYPTLSFLDRRCTRNYKVPNSDLTIEKGIPVYISMWSLHYDENYFPEPQTFDPERFSPENKSNIRPYTYMPFGEGYRNCLGAKFGTLAVCVGIILILKNFKVEKGYRTPQNITFEHNGFLLIPEGGTVYVKFKNIVE